MSQTEQRRQRAALLRILKRAFVGRPVSSHLELQHRLTKRVALAVFSSDALSSSAYATDEIFLALAVAGTAALSRSIPISLAIIFVLGVVVVSYRQTVKAYPSGGGAYIVAHDNLGEMPGLMAASALLIDYVLTVSVSTAAGVAAISSAVPDLAPHRVAMALAVVGLITLANFRGLKESGRIFAIPTYGFLLSIGLMIVVGVVRVATGNYHPAAPAPHLAPEHALTAFLVLKAFASGSTALTGIEAISNGVPAFKPPEDRNASTTLLVLGVLLSALFVGITFLANTYHVNPELIEKGVTGPSQIASGVFGAGSVLFYLVQTFTAMILFLAANTSYADFPRLSSILARDRYLPSILKHRGDKLAFSNGVLVLALAAGAVLWHYGAEVHRIIPLYVIGVFTSFTLSQGGMVRRWLRLKGPNWRRSAGVNAFGALVTFLVLIIVGSTKFALGAWQILILIPVVALILRRIGRHYRYVHQELLVGEAEQERVEVNKAIVLVSPFPGATLKALSFARAFAPRELHVVAFRVRESKLREIRRRWRDLDIRQPVEATGHRMSDLIEYVKSIEPTKAQPVIVVLPEPQHPNPLRQFRWGRLMLRAKGALLFQRGVAVASVPFRPGVELDLERLRAPARLSLIVLVSAVHRATVRALELARSLGPSEMKALTIATDPEEGDRMTADWERLGLDIPLEVLDSPYRSLIEPLRREIRKLRPDEAHAVGVVVPEFLVAHWWQQFLHNQTALVIKFALVREPDVIVINVPYTLEARRKNRRTADLT